MQQSLLPLPNKCVRYALDLFILRAKLAGLKIRTLKMSTQEFIQLRAAMKDTGFSGTYRGYALRLVVGHRWIS